MPTPCARDAKGVSLCRQGGPVLPTVINEMVGWGPYEAAIRSHEEVVGRPPPPPGPPLSPRFVEWMMGLPDGWVTGVTGVPRTRALRMLGNGVVPHQAAHAVRLLAGWLANKETEGQP